MLIGVDAHNLEGKRTGVGRYLFCLLRAWSVGDFSHTTEYEKNPRIKFILYFKDEVPADLPRSSFFVCKLLSSSSTVKFIHWNLWRAAKKDRVDVLFCPGYVAPLFWRGKLALTLHDIIYETHPEWFNWKSPVDKVLLKWVSKRSAKRADLIFVPLKFSQEEVIKYYKIDANKIVVTPEAADSLLTAMPADMDFKIKCVKEKYGIKNNFVFYVGSIFSRRHLPEIIQAFKKLSLERCQLLIGGQDYTKNKSVDALVREVNEILGQQAILRVDFIPDSDLKLLYSACAFFIWLSDYEGFGLPMLEAMSLGVPVITSSSTSLKEVAGDAAILIKNNADVREIFAAMEKIKTDEILRLNLIVKGKEQAKRFSWEACAEKTLEALLRA